MKYCFLFLLFISFSAAGQDLYNFNNSRKYAAHLKSSRQFETAIIEYERLLFLQPSNDTILKDLTTCYNRSARFKKTIQLLDTVQNPDQDLRYNLLVALIEERKFSEIDRIALSGTEDRTLIFLPAAMALRGDLKRSLSTTDSLLVKQNDLRYTKLKAETEKYLETKWKSPHVAASLSLIPGAGKVYTRNYSDALMSFIMTGGLAFQTYRGFSKNGVKSAYGWIYGGLAFGFYTGNIYGSWKAAKKYNKQKRDAYDAKVRHIILSDK